MRYAFAILSGLLVLAVLGQFFLAGFSVLDPAPVDTSFATHLMLGHQMSAASILVIAGAALARAGRGTIGLAALITLLLFGQILLGTIATALGGDTGSTAGQVVFGFHVINGLAILVLSSTVFHRALAHAKGAKDTDTAPPVQSTV